MVAMSVASTTTLTLADCPAGMFPSADVITPFAKLAGAPWLGVAEMSEKSAASCDDAITPVASDGPRLFTMSVYVQSASTQGWPEPGAIVTARSAEGVTWTKADVVLFPGFGSKF